MEFLVVSTDELKSHLGLDGIDVDNALLELYIKSSTEYAFVYLEKVLTTENLDSVESCVKLAILMLASHYFNNREATTEIQNTQVQFGVHALLDKARVNISC